MLALATLIIASSGPVWIGVGSLDPQVPPLLVERIDALAANSLGLAQRQSEDLEAWQQRLVAIDASFRQGNLEASRNAVSRLIAALTSDQHPWLQSINLLADALLMLGQIQLLLDDELGAAAAFQSHHALRPAALPDASLYHPDILLAYERLAVATLAGARRSLQVGARPVGATIWLDGKPRGQTPMTLNGLLPGRHYLRIVAGVRSIQQVVDLGNEGRIVSVDLGAGAQTLGSFFAAWRKRAGLPPLRSALVSSGEGRRRFALALRSSAKGYELFGVRFDTEGQVSALSKLELADEKTDLAPVEALVRSLRDGDFSQPPERLIEQAFGRPPSVIKPLVLGAVASGVLVAAASAVLLALWLQEDSGIVIDPGRLR